MPLLIEVAAALIQDAEGRYLITQRRQGSHLEGLWEFPGGKRDVGESPEAALVANEPGRHLDDQRHGAQAFT